MAVPPRVGLCSVRLYLAILVLGNTLDRCQGWTSCRLLQRSSAVATRSDPTLQVQPTSDQEDVAMEAASSSAPEAAAPVSDTADTDVSPYKPSPVSSQQQPPPSLSTRDMTRALGTSPRRIFLSGITGAGIALTGNLFGVTSQLLTLVPEDTVEATGLDTYFPRGPYKRFKTADYTFAMPREWVADTAIELAKAQRRSMSLDYSMRSQPISSGVLPDAAFGPPGNRVNSNAAAASDTNVSLIRTDTPPNFDLRRVMGEPVVGAQFLLQNFLAPAGSGRTATLLSVDESSTGVGGRASYRLAYTIERGDRGVPLQAIAIIAQGRATLVTMTIVAPVETWKTDFAPKLYKMADSFRLVS